MAEHIYIDDYKHYPDGYEHEHLKYVKYVDPNSSYDDQFHHDRAKYFVHLDNDIIVYDNGRPDHYRDHRPSDQHIDDGTFTEQYLLAWGRANVDGIAELAARTNKHRCGLWCRVNGCRHKPPAFYHPDDPEYDGDDSGDSWPDDEFFDQYAYDIINDINDLAEHAIQHGIGGPHNEHHHIHVEHDDNDTLVEYINDYYDGDLGRLPTSPSE